MAATPVREALRVCVFEVAGRMFALGLDSVREIVPMASLTRPPSMPSMLEGFLNLRGTAIAVVKTARLLSLPPDPVALHTLLIVLKGTDIPLALIVNGVSGIIAAFGDDVLPIPAQTSFNGCVNGELRTANGAIHVLSAKRLLLEKERQVLAEFQEAEERRLHAIHTELA